jgi:myo-inositol catabolism protein IolC
MTSDQQLKRVKRATERRADAERAWVLAILEAHRAGQTLRAIAREAGVTNPRVHQIIKQHGGES